MIKIFSNFCFRFTNGARLQIRSPRASSRRVPADVQPDTGARRMLAQSTAGERWASKAHCCRGYGNTLTLYQGFFISIFYLFSVFCCCTFKKTNLNIRTEKFYLEYLRRIFHFRPFMLCTTRSSYRINDWIQFNLMNVVGSWSAYWVKYFEVYFRKTENNQRNK